MVREHNDRMQAVWIGAQLTAYAPQRSGKFTKLDKLLISDAPKRRDTPEQRLATAQAWAAAFSKR